MKIKYVEIDNNAVYIYTETQDNLTLRFDDGVSTNVIFTKGDHIVTEQYKANLIDRRTKGGDTV